MRHVLHLLAFVLTADAPPKFEVVNKCPPKIEVVNLCPARSVPATTFRNGSFHASHQCPECGRSQYRISGWVGNGQHRHTCASCGASWVH